LYGCETWCVTQIEEHAFRVFENRVLRRIFGPKGDKVTGGWRNLHNEKLHKLYSSLNIVSMIKSRSEGWEENVARMGKMTNARKFFVGKPEETNRQTL
jgi:hypothetical protein